MIQNGADVLLVDIKDTSFLINGTSLIEVMGWDKIERVFNAVSSDLNFFFNKIDGDEVLFFPFEAANWIRHDNIRDKELFELFVLKLLGELANSYSIKKIHFKSGIISRSFLKYLAKHYDVEFSSGTKGIVFLNSIFQELSSFIKYFGYLLVKCLIKREKNKKIDNIVVVNSRLSNRLGDLEKYLEAQEFTRFFYRENIRDPECENRFLDYLKLKSLAIVFIKTLRYKLFILRSTKRELAGAPEFSKAQFDIINPTVLELFIGLARFHSIKDCFLESRPRCVVCSGSLNKASSRRVFKAARDLGIKTINIIDKPFSEKLITMSAGVSSNSIGLAEYHLVINDYHKNILKKLGIIKKVGVGYKGGAIETDLSLVKREKEYEHKRVVLILGINEGINLRLISDLLNNVNFSDTLDVSRIELLIKFHPVKPLSEQKLIAKFLEKTKFRDVTDSKWSEIIQQRNTIGVTAFSTAMFEFASYGGGVIWAPYYSLQSVISSFIMHDIGVIAKDDIDLCRVLTDCITNQCAFESLLSKSKENLLKYKPEGSLLESFIEMDGLRSQ